MSDKDTDTIGREMSANAPPSVSLVLGLICGLLALPGTVTLLTGQTVTTNIRELLFLVVLWAVFAIVGVPAIRHYYRRLTG